MGDQRNLILFFVATIIIFLVYDMLVMNPARQRIAQEREAAQALETQDPAELDAFDGVIRTPERSISRDDALTQTGRVTILPGRAADGGTTGVAGSLSLRGARLDDLRLLRHTVSIDSGEPVTLLNPQGGDHAYFAQDGWLTGSTGPRDAPGNDADWRLASGEALSPGSPVTLIYEGSDGLVFERTIELDEDYMFTVTDRVTNTATEAATLSRYGRVRRHGLPPDLSNFFILHEGPIAVVGGRLFDRKYDRLRNGSGVTETGTGGWVGMTDKYWLAAVIPDQSVPFTAEFRMIERAGEEVYQVSYQTRAVELAPGETHVSQSHIYAGAKTVEVLQRYQNDLGIQRLDMAVDWGMFWFLTRPFFSVLHWFTGVFGNVGLAILTLTVGVKLIFFPLANKAYVSMAKMRAIQPKMTEVRERFAADKQRQQQEMIELYKREKVNPLAGCLPILVQIPVFYALYKTLFVTIEVRHQPFFGWIRDLSAADPTSVWNLFGLLPWDPSGWPVLGGFLAIGAWPIIMGVTMYLQQALNPPPPDPIQARIFAFLPFVFTIILAPFAAGLVIYWAWNNFLSILQQYVIMRRQGVETQFDKIVAKLMKRGQGGAEG